MATYAFSTPTPQARRSPANHQEANLPLEAPASRTWTEQAIAALIDHLDSLDAAGADLEPDDDSEDTDGCEPEEDCCVDDPSPYWPGVRIVSNHRGPL